MPELYDALMGVSSQFPGRLFSLPKEELNSFLEQVTTSYLCMEARERSRLLVEARRRNRVLNPVGAPNPPSMMMVHVQMSGDLIDQLRALEGDHSETDHILAALLADSESTG